MRDIRASQKRGVGIVGESSIQVYRGWSPLPHRSQAPNLAIMVLCTDKEQTRCQKGRFFSPWPRLVSWAVRCVVQ